MPRQAIIITIGDELLIGQTLDTNSVYIAQALGGINIEVIRKVAIRDKKEDIIEALDDALSRADLVIFTGGLGPTADDITKPVLCDYFGGTMVRNQQVLAHVEAIFSKRNMPMLDRNARQADVPDVCTVLFNQLGTAPGMLFERDGKLVASLPGVPFEMQHILDRELLPVVQTRLQSSVQLLHRHLVTSGIAESVLAERIEDIETALPEYMHLAYLPSLRMVKLRLTAEATDPTALSAEMDAVMQQIAARIPAYVIGTDDVGLDIYATRLLLEKNLLLATAESCTGGYFGHQVTNVAGSSKYYKGGVISYANDIKQSLIGVQQSTLMAYGAVSEETVREMALGAVQELKADIAISFSGILGPEGGTPEKPVGLVWLAIANSAGIVETRKMQLRYTRLVNKEAVVNEGWAFLRSFILDHY
ncbi:competence/damage-inducible protein A [Edaphocola flava]|uniref:competence/damage-inducible protein A n=1 Tax=Edaphocola flava TaxID=2499629 RepID=UPI00100AED45|nr:competence/damage-inducible protein A [Edaphocola flava]